MLLDLFTRLTSYIFSKIKVFLIPSLKNTQQFTTVDSSITSPSESLRAQTVQELKRPEKIASILVKSAAILLRAKYPHHQPNQEIIISLVNIITEKLFLEQREHQNTSLLPRRPEEAYLLSNYLESDFAKKFLKEIAQIFKDSTDLRNLEERFEELFLEKIARIEVLARIASPITLFRPAKASSLAPAA